MKCKVLCFLLCVLFCFSSLGLSSSAVDELEDYIFFPEDLIDLGYIQVNDDHYVLPGENEISLFTSSTKHYDFNPLTDIPWSKFPDYIKEIIYMDCDDLKKTEGSFLVPFFSAAVVSASTVQIFVGTNVAWGWLNNSEMQLSIWSLPQYVDIASTASLYRLSWNYKNNTVASDWVSYTPATFGTKGNLNRVLSYYFNYSSTVDFYCYGGNGVLYPTNYEFDNGVTNTGSISTHCMKYNNSGGMINFAFSSVGFSDKHIIANPEYFSNFYFDYIKPVSEEQLLQEQQNQLLEEQNSLIEEGNETSDSIFEYIQLLPSKIALSIKGFFTDLGDRISSFFEKLVEDIKGLFIPEEGFFEDYIDEYGDYFNARFGLLYEIPSAIIGIFRQLVNYEPVTSGYGIDFPEVVMPVLDNGEWYDKVIIENTRYEFDFLDEGPIATLYSMYRSALWLMFIFLLINLIIRKSNKVFGGGSG